MPVVRMTAVHFQKNVSLLENKLIYDIILITLKHNSNFINTLFKQIFFVNL